MSHITVYGFHLTGHSLDEVSALVIDIGHSSLRAGYAGDDTPKAVIPTHYGYISSPSDQAGDVTMGEDGAEGETSAQPTKKTKLYVGQSGPSVWRAGMEVGNPSWSLVVLALARVQKTAYCVSTKMR